VGTRANLSTPTAILIGSLIIAVGLFMALRRSEPTIAPIVDLPAPPAVPVPATPVASRETVTRQASEALAYHRPALRDRCYGPVVAGEAPPRPAKLIFNVTFDAAGVQVMRGVVEPRDTSIPEVTRCVGDHLPALRVAPPGATMMVEVPLEFP